MEPMKNKNKHKNHPKLIPLTVEQKRQLEQQIRLLEQNFLLTSEEKRQLEQTRRLEQEIRLLEQSLTLEGKRWLEQQIRLLEQIKLIVLKLAQTRQLVQSPLLALEQKWQLEQQIRLLEQDFLLASEHTNWLEQQIHQLEQRHREQKRQHSAEDPLIRIIKSILIAVLLSVGCLALQEVAFPDANFRIFFLPR